MYKYIEIKVCHNLKYCINLKKRKKKQKGPQRGNISSAMELTHVHKEKLTEVKSQEISRRHEVRI